MFAVVLMYDLYVSFQYCFTAVHDMDGQRPTAYTRKHIMRWRPTTNLLHNM